MLKSELQTECPKCGINYDGTNLKVKPHNQCELLEVKINGKFYNSLTEYQKTFHLEVNPLPDNVIQFRRRAK